MLRAVVVCAFVALTFAQGENYAPARISFLGSETGYGRTFDWGTWKSDDLSANYAKNFTGNTKLTYQSNFIEACRTLMGVVPCNKHNSVCQDVPDSIAWDNAVYHPEYTSRVVNRPQVCISRHLYRSPDAYVLFVANVMFCWILLSFGLYAIIVRNTNNRGTLTMKVIAGFFYVPLALMFFSYYYYNAILGFAALFASYQLFTLKRADLTAFAFVFLFLAYYQVTFENGLGYVQHQSRLGPNLKSSDNTYENLCNQYYRSAFNFAPQVHGDFDNPLISTWGYCHREWLSAGLFYMIWFELAVLLSVFAGASALYVPIEEAQPVAQETEMESKA